MLAIAAMTLGLAACSSNTPVDPGDYRTIPLRLPNGKTIRVERAADRLEIAQGVRFRKSLDPDRGLLLIYGAEGFYPFWNYQVEVRLDVIWMDKNHKIVQLLHDTPPCLGARDTCMQFGGAFAAQYVLDLPSGAAKRYGLKPGMTLDF